MRQMESTWEEDVQEHFGEILEAVNKKHPGVEDFWKEFSSEIGTVADGFVQLYSLSTQELTASLKELADPRLALKAVMEPLHALQRVRGAALPGQGKFIRAVQDALAPKG
jgi:hypothetical protein